jgi:methionine-gamma-lyase
MIDSMFEEWNEQRPEIITSQNYSSSEDFKNIIDSFSTPTNKKGITSSLETLGNFLKEENDGIYARGGHPNFAQLEERVKLMEIGNLSHSEYFGAKVFSSGMAAIFAALSTLSNDREGFFIKGDVMYHSAGELLKKDGKGRCMVGSLPGVELDLNSQNSPNILTNYLEMNKNGQNIPVLGIILETVANPTITYADIRSLAEIAHNYDTPLIVDNTILSPYLLEPFRMGADIVIQSITKNFGGQGDMVGGVAVGPNEFMKKLHEQRTHTGGVMSIDNAYEYATRIPNFIKNIETSCKNSKYLANELQTIDSIDVNYPNLDGKTREGYAGNVLSFEFKGDNDQDVYNKSVKFHEHLMENKDLVKCAVSFGEPKTLVVPYASQFGDLDIIKETNAFPVGLVRVGVGRENQKDFSKVVQYIKNGIEHI